MQWKMICLDVDGTLMTTDEKLLPEVKETLQEAAKKGIRLALATGRMPSGVAHIEQELGVPCIKICIAGTYALCGDQPVYARYLKTGVLSRIYQEVSKRRDTPLWFFRDQEWYVTGIDSFIEDAIKRLQCRPRVVEGDRFISDWEARGLAPNKLLLSAPAGAVKELHQELDAYHSPDFDVTQSDTCFMEVLPKGVNKGTALQAVCRVLHIDPAQVLAFGDQEIDMPLLQTAGCGVAMGNAISILKETADFITTGNNEGGVAYALRALNVL